MISCEGTEPTEGSYAFLTSRKSQQHIRDQHQFIIRPAFPSPFSMASSWEKPQSTAGTFLLCGAALTAGMSPGAALYQEDILNRRALVTLFPGIRLHMEQKAPGTRCP